jgi:hypothetical protein
MEKSYIYSSRQQVVLSNSSRTINCHHAECGDVVTHSLIRNNADFLFDLIFIRFIIGFKITLIIHAEHKIFYFLVTTVYISRYSNYQLSVYKYGCVVDS